MAGGSTEWRGRSVVSKVVALLDAFSPVPRSCRWASRPADRAARLDDVPAGVRAGGLGRAGARRRRRVPRRPADVGDRGARAARRDAARGGAALHERPVRGDAGERAPRRARRRGGALRREALGPPRDAGAHPPGRRLPLHATAAGKVLLAHAPESLFRETVAAGLRRYTAHTVIAPGHLRRALTEIRRSGIAYAREELTVGSHSVASPVLDADGGGGRPVGDAARGPHGPAPAGPGGAHGGDLGAARAAAAGAARARRPRPGSPRPGAEGGALTAGAAAILAP